MSSERLFTCPTLADLPETARRILEFGNDRTVWLFEGEMGAGKTTFIKALCKELGVSQLVQSPTFALVNEYETTQHTTVYHFDFYRIKSETEALDLGIDEYFDSGNLCLVEWPSLIPSLWPPDRLEIQITAQPDDSRIISVVKQ